MCSESDIIWIDDLGNGETWVEILECSVEDFASAIVVMVWMWKVIKKMSRHMEGRSIIVMCNELVVINISGIMATLV